MALFESSCQYSLFKQWDKNGSRILQLWSDMRIFALLANKGPPAQSFLIVFAKL